MTPRTWLDDEPPASASLRQAGALVVAGLRRPVALALSVVAFVGLVALGVLLAKRSYAPAYVLAVVEAEHDPGGMPRPRRMLAEYVRQAVFTSAPLLDVIRRHGLYPGLSQRNPHAAVDSFREDIDVDAYQNGFIEDRAAGEAPRSARLRISYHGATPDLAVTVTRELGELVVSHETAARRDLTSRAAELARQETVSAERALSLRRAELVARREEVRRSTQALPERQVELVGLMGTIAGLEMQQEASERREAELSLAAAIERRGVGTSFVVIDDASLFAAEEARKGRLSLALASILLGLPLVTMAVGAGAAPARKART
jgi:hypothetical protein